MVSGSPLTLKRISEWISVARRFPLARWLQAHLDGLPKTHASLEPAPPPWLLRLRLPLDEHRAQGRSPGKGKTAKTRISKLFLFSVGLSPLGRRRPLGPALALRGCSHECSHTRESGGSAGHTGPLEAVPECTLPGCPRPGLRAPSLERGWEKHPAAGPICRAFLLRHNKSQIN